MSVSWGLAVLTEMPGEEASSSRTNESTGCRKRPKQARSDIGYTQRRIQQEIQLRHRKLAAFTGVR